tara:strand:- start:491 stop:919 length:429 start_codon:yes stop_codon:yes gene_type:complete
MIKFLIITTFSLFVNYACANDNIINERIKNFKSAKQSMKVINQSLIKENYLHINDHILFLYNWFKILPSYFPLGSEASMTNNSDASAEIWENFALFKKYSNNSKNISLKMLKSLDKNERKNIQLKFDELARSCSTCHRKFRN